jgi:hypothetical protein
LETLETLETVDWSTYEPPPFPELRRDPFLNLTQPLVRMMRPLLIVNSASDDLDVISSLLAHGQLAEPAHANENDIV